MSYVPTDWKNGDVVTSAKLNKLEQGVQDVGPLIIEYSSFDTESGVGTLDHTWSEINDADFAVLRNYSFDGEGYTWDGSISLLVFLGSGVGEWSVIFYNPRNSTQIIFVSDSADGYPHYLSE